MKTIVALVDFSDLTFKVLKQAHTLAKAFNSEVVILHVDPKTYVVGTTSEAGEILVEPPAESVQLAQQMLNEVKESLAKFGVTVTAQELRGHTVEVVLSETNRLNADLIILGSHHHSSFYNLLIGSVTSEILKRAHCPLLVVPNDGGAVEKESLAGKH